MIVPDANLLIYAHHPASDFHTASRVWFESTLSSGETVGIPIHSIYAFLRFMTHPGIHPRPLGFQEAAGLVDSWLALPQVRVLYPEARHWDVLKQFGLGARASGNLITDAAIAAVAVEHGGVLYTNDRDFDRFADLSWRNPLSS